ncbi:MAG TPA: O-antigen ligase family protein, partial [Bryobacteraceae bacterium]|nr:O-antigen ligase family protein [Bryobacteraceae bacterium]
MGVSGGDGRLGRAYLILLAIALAYAVVHDGGTAQRDWNVSLAILGVAGIVYWWRTAPADLAPWPGPWMPRLALALPLYVALQLVPLPVAWLKVVTPERAKILAWLGQVMAAPRFAALSVAPPETAAYLLRIAGYTVAFLLAREIVSRSRGGWAAALPLIAIAAIEAGWGLAQLSGDDGVHGSYENKNHFAGLLEMVLPLTVAGGFALADGAGSRIGRRGRRAFAACAAFALAGVMLAALLDSMSKMGFIASLAGLLVMGLIGAAWMLRGWRKWALGAGLVALFPVALISLPSDELVQSFGRAASDTSGEGRVPIWRDTLHLAGAYPVFGSGLGTFDTVFLKYQTAVVDRDFNFAHNDYLEFAAELGGVGFLILAGLMLTIFAKTIRRVARGPDLDSRFLALGCAGSIAAIGVHSLADFNMYIPGNALMLAWISGIAAGIPTRTRGAGYGRIFRIAGIALGVLLIAYTSAWALMENRFRSDARAEALFCRFGVCDTGAVAQPETALLREPSSPWRWCDLGEAEWKAGQVERARYCFKRGIELGPDVPPVLMRAADFYRGLPENTTALQQAAAVLDTTDAYDDLVFTWFRKNGVTTKEVLEHGLPQGPRAARSYFGYLISSGTRGDMAQAWGLLLARQYADDKSAWKYANFLFNDLRYDQAARATADYLGKNGDGYLTSNYVFNGDFESNQAENPFDWKLDQRAGVKASIDSNAAYSGHRSARVDFDGTKNVEWIDLSDSAYAPPGRYRFQARVKLDGITTDQGPSFSISGEQWKVETDNMTGTTDWRLVEKSFDVPNGSGLVQIHLFRRKSWKFDSLIRGTVWIDQVKIVPE